MNAKAFGAGAGDDGLQRVEVRTLGRQAVGAGFEPIGEIGIATSSDLHEKRVEAAAARRPHQLGDGLGRGQADARDPQSPNFRRRLGPEGTGGGQQQRRQRQDVNPKQA